jgi:hypothetical protein
MKALSMKGPEYGVVEWPSPLQIPMQRMIFGRRTVPGLRIGGREDPELAPDHAPP